MKTQLEISWASEPFALVALTSTDGHRLARERQQQEADRAESAQLQTSLPLPAARQNTTPPRYEN